jgi:hypothetical protein
MAWAKIDDRFFSHPKVRSAGKDAILLYLAALTYSNEHLTEGFVPEDSLPLIALYAFVDDFKQSASKLVEVGLWHASTKCLSNGYEIHDYHEYNPTKEQVEQTRKARAEAGSKGGKASVESKKKQMPSKKEANAKQKSSNIPSPPLPINSSPKGEESTPEKPYSLAQALAGVCGMDFEANKGRLLKEAKLLEKGSPPPTSELITKHYGAGTWWYQKDWRGQKDEPPAPPAVRETWGKWIKSELPPRKTGTVEIEVPGIGRVEAKR